MILAYKDFTYNELEIMLKRRNREQEILQQRYNNDELKKDDYVEQIQELRTQVEIIIRAIKQWQFNRADEILDYKKFWKDVRLGKI